MLSSAVRAIAALRPLHHCYIRVEPRLLVAFDAIARSIYTKPMAALPHAQPTIMEVEGSERPVQREVALCDVIEDKAKKEMACVSFHKNLKTKI